MESDKPPSTSNMETPFQSERFLALQNASFRQLAIETIQLQNAMEL